MKMLLFLSMLLTSSLAVATSPTRLSSKDLDNLNRHFVRISAPLRMAFGTGDVVGNGGGLLEQNFMLAYFSVQLALENCFSDLNCFSNEEERDVLKEINKAYISKIDQETPLIFLQNSLGSTFFLDEFDKTERLAKTGFSIEHSIFINMEMAYDIRNDIPAMISIIIHELGHQIGILKHSYLDRLSSKVRKSWNQN